MRFNDLSLEAKAVCIDSYRKIVGDKEFVELMEQNLVMDTLQQWESNVFVHGEVCVINENELFNLGELFEAAIHGDGYYLEAYENAWHFAIKYSREAVENGYMANESDIHTLMRNHGIMFSDLGIPVYVDNYREECEE